MSIVDKALKNPVQLAIGIGIVVAVVYFAGRALAKTAGGLVSGDNALTKGTAYESKGIAGTLGAAANTASGGALEGIGDWLGGKLYDWTHADYDPNEGLNTAAKQVRLGGESIDNLWGRIGSVELRVQ